MTRDQIADGLLRVTLHLANGRDVPDGWSPDEWAYVKGIASAAIMQLHDRLIAIGSTGNSPPSPTPDAGGDA